MTRWIRGRCLVLPSPVPPRSRRRITPDGLAVSRSPSSRRRSASPPENECARFLPWAAYQEAGLLASGMVSLTTSHRRETQAFLSALASACRNTTVFSGRNETTKSSPSARIATFRLSGRLITPIRSDMKASPLADPLCLEPSK